MPVRVQHGTGQLIRVYEDANTFYREGGSLIVAFEERGAYPDKNVFVYAPGTWTWGQVIEEDDK